MGVHKKRPGANAKPRGQGKDYRCECGQPSVVVMWLVQFTADDRTYTNFVPLCADCLELERQYNGEPARLTPAPLLQNVAESGNMQNQVLAWLVRHGPANSRQLADNLHISYSSAWNSIQRLARSGQVAVVDEIRQSNGTLTKVWGINAR